MPVFDGVETYRPTSPGAVVTVGNFDGVHRGHQAILARACKFAGERKARVAAVTFEPPPASILAPQRMQPRLTTHDDRLKLLKLHGADDVIVLRSEPALFARPAIDFLREVVVRCRPVAFVEGPTFMFGRGREGSNATLREHAAEFGYGVDVVAPVELSESGSSVGASGAGGGAADREPPPPASAFFSASPRVVISSSNIRARLAEGRVDLAAAMLGRPHVISGRVVRGDGRGAPLGFPTVNLSEIPQMVPADGVYAAVAELSDGTRRAAGVNVGPQPTFGGVTSRVEAHLLDFSGDVRGEWVRLQFVERLRGQRTFADAGELVEQIGIDVCAVRRMGLV